ncbi:ATP-binding protein [Pseudactinotalea suaedae]|uniref:ATP-binding protein n=1 Tax=Pseudactinotalea suaedae TaxID=1524924 RepID=UPI0012E2EB4C|nr:ATP-binding protein [Pseudactinotalea suaedae]
MTTDDADLTRFLTAFGRLAESANHYASRDRLGDKQRLGDRLAEHLGSDPATMPVLTEEVSPFRFADVDLALEAILEEAGGGELIGVGGGEQRWHTSLSEMLNATYVDFPVGPVDYEKVPTGPDTERSAVAFGIYLFRWEDDGGAHPVAVLTRGTRAQYGATPRLEVLAADSGIAAALLARVGELMSSRSVLRGQIVTFGGSEFEATLGVPSQGQVTFQPRPSIPAADIVLPAGTLTKVERHVLGIGAHRETLARAGQHLKRGVLLYGPPGTGKTLTVRHLLGMAENTTVIMLTGMALQLISLATQTARALQPAIVVLEDCDLVAEQRDQFHSSPLLFEVLDALDGLAADSDVTFLLTTNRVDVLEPALAQRPGRVDLAVEIPRPDRAARRQLLTLYGRGLPFSDTVLDEVARDSDGTTASFAKELVRRAVLLAAVEEQALADDHLRAALAEMMTDSSAITRALLGGGDWPDSGGGYA